jgi:hypothetical protein
MSLKLMREKGIISQAEYDSAVKDLENSTGQRAPEEGTVVVSKIAITMYGFVQDDNIYDTTQSLNDIEGNSQIARPNTVAGMNGRFTMGLRNTRLGFRMKAPELLNGDVRTSGTIESDFLGAVLPIGSSQPYQGTEGSFFTSPTFRMRHAFLKVETPIVDVLAGQYWELFGFQPYYQPNTVQIQGVPNQIYSRTPQVRVSKTIKASPVILDLAIAMTRPVQRDSGTPDGQAGIRLSIDSWQTVQTQGQVGTQISPASIAVSGLLRHVAVNNLAASPTFTNDLGMAAWAVDAFLPIIPATKDHWANALSLLGEFSKGSGYADKFTGLNMGAGFPVPPGATLPSCAITAGAPAACAPFNANIDNGIVGYDSGGGLHSLDFQTVFAGLQYYTPINDGKVWLSGNFSYGTSDNVGLYNSATKVTSNYWFFDGILFWEATDFVRVGGEYGNFHTQYWDGINAINHRFQLDGFLVF